MFSSVLPQVYGVNGFTGETSPIFVACFLFVWICRYILIIWCYIIPRKLLHPCGWCPIISFHGYKFYRNFINLCPKFKQTNFDAPLGVDPVALDLSSMGKGQAWVNGKHIGRYWTQVAPTDGCRPCDYCGAYNSDKCTTNCGNATQTWYSSNPKHTKYSRKWLIVYFISLWNYPREF